MAKNSKKPDLKKPKFNSYWIYAAIIVVFIGLNLFGGGSWSQLNKTTHALFYLVVTNFHHQKDLSL